MLIYGKRWGRSLLNGKGQFHFGKSKPTYLTMRSNASTWRKFPRRSFSQSCAKENSELKFLAFAISFPRQLGYKFIWSLLWCHELNISRAMIWSVPIPPVHGLRRRALVYPCVASRWEVSACTGACCVFRKWSNLAQWKHLSLTF